MPQKIKINYDWDKLSDKEVLIVEGIGKRAVQLKKDLDYMGVQMDIGACHITACRLDLKELLAASDFEFMHDVLGISRHFNRDTGMLEDCFWPRFAKQNEG